MDKIFKLSLIVNINCKDILEDDNQKQDNNHNHKPNIIPYLLFSPACTWQVGISTIDMKMRKEFNEYI